MRIANLDRIAASAPGRDYKRRFLAGMDLDPTCTVLDLGCGPGTDLASMAQLAGQVIGADHDPEMLAEASGRTAGLANVRLLRGDAHALPLAEASADRIRTDRVLQHVAEPAGVLAEMHRVCRPGGRIAMAEPDWGTLAIDDEDMETSRAYTSFITRQVVRNARIGLQLPRLARAAGFAVERVEAIATVFEDPHTVLRVPEVAERAIQAGAMPEGSTRDWLERLTSKPFLASTTLWLTFACR